LREKGALRRELLWLLAQGAFSLYSGECSRIVEQRAACLAGRADAVLAAGSLCLLCLRLQSLRAVCAEDLDAVLRLGECDQIIDRCDILGQLLKERVGSGLLAVCPDSLEICLAGGLRLRASGRSRDKLLYFFDCFLFCHKKILLILHWGAE